MKHIILRSGLILLVSLSVVFEVYTQSQPLRIGVAGLSHSHVHQLLKRPDKGDINIVGIYESDTALVERLAGLYGFSMDIVYDDLDTMLEKPLSANLEQALEMERIAPDPYGVSTLENIKSANTGQKIQLNPDSGVNQ